MLGEVRVRTDAGKTAKASRDASARVSCPYPSAAGAVTGPIPKGKGICKIFSTDEGCPLGRTCPYEHPQDP
eukprot:1444198-Prorocentrum_lima.AAC.1